MAAFDWVKPASFAGTFYPGDPESLNETLERMDREAETLLEETPEDVVGIVAPHAGYVYSGTTAAAAYRAARGSDPETVVVLGLSHRTRVEGVSILEAAACRTPLGESVCDSEFLDALLPKMSAHSFQIEAHLSEHSVETQLPFIQRTFSPETRIVEILTQEVDPESVDELGKAIADTAKELDRKILVVASTDFSHYPSCEAAEKIDRESIEALLVLDPARASRDIAELEARGIEETRCAVCSKAAVYSGMVAARELGARYGVRLAYSNSGWTPGGDRSRVVGYGAIAWAREG